MLVEKDPESKRMSLEIVKKKSSPVQFFVSMVLGATGLKLVETGPTCL